MLSRLVKRSIVPFFTVALLGWAPTASAVSIVGGGIDVGGACVDAACPSTTDFALAALAPATGTVTITPTGGGFPTHNVDLVVDVASLTLSATGGPVGGVDTIVFTNLTFDVSAIPAQDSGGTLFLVGTPLVTVTGTYEQFLGASSVVGPTFFSQSVSLTSLACATDGSGNCGWGLQLTGGSPLSLNVGTGGGSSHDFGFTFNVAIPEPSTAMLLGLGLVGLVTAGRRRA